MKFTSNPFHVFIAFMAVSIITLSNCTKVVEPTLTYPSTYTFNTPIVTEKFDYRYSDTTNTWKDITALDTFADNKDTIITQINDVFKREFQDEFIQSITLEDGTNASVDYGVLDTLGKFISAGTRKETYKSEGNDLIFSSGKKYAFDYSFREMIACRKMVFVRDISQGKSTTFLFTDKECNILSGPILEQIKAANVNNAYKTAHIRTVHSIFSNYK